MGRGWTIAIDFGTTATVAAVDDEDGVRVLEIDGARAIPSTVAWVGDGLVVGAEAERRRRFDPAVAAVHPKRSLGRRARLPIGPQGIPTTEAVAALLRAVLDEAVTGQAGPPDRAVLTHPVRWRDDQLTALVDAATLARLPEVHLVPEPVAAALQVGFDRLRDGEHCVVYDLGGGTFDCAVLVRTGTSFELAGPPGGREDIGGDDFDRRLVELVADHLGRRDPAAADDLVRADDAIWRRARAELALEARQAKEALSRQTTYDLTLPPPLHGEVRLTRAELEALIVDDLQTTMTETLDTIRAAGVEPEDLRLTCMTGGASRTPLVTRLLQESLGAPPATLDDPKLVVALGALRWAGRAEPAAASPGPAPPADARPVAPAPPNGQERPPPPPVPPVPASPSPGGPGDSTKRRPHRLLVGLGLTAALLAIAVGAFVWLRAVGDGPDGRATATVPGTLTGLSAGTDGLWVTADDPGAVARIDGTSGAVDDTLTLGGSPLAAAQADASLWVIDADGDRVSRLDPDTARVETTIAVGRGPLAVTGGGGSVWVANYDDDTVSRIEASSDRVTATFPVGGGPAALAFGEGALWVVNGDDGTVQRIDPSTGSTVATIAVGAQPIAVAAGSKTMWVANYGDGTVSRIDTDRNRVTQTIPVADGPLALAVDGSDVWVAASRADEVLLVEAGANTVTRTLRTGPGPAALALTDGALWVGEGVSGTIRRVELD